MSTQVESSSATADLLALLAVGLITRGYHCYSCGRNSPTPDDFFSHARDAHAIRTTSTVEQPETPT